MSGEKRLNEETLDAVTGGAGGTADQKVLFVKANCADCANNKNGQTCPYLAAEAAKAEQAAKSGGSHHCQFKKAATSACLV